jgi:hypothetical protein
MVVGQQHFGGLEPVADTYLAHIARRRSSRRSGNDSGARRREGRLVDVGSIVSPESRHRCQPSRRQTNARLSSAGSMGANDTIASNPAAAARRVNVVSVGLLEPSS